MASHPPKQCCYQGVKWDGNAQGEMKMVGEYETYFSYPESKSTERAILLITDVIGHTNLNVQLLADQFAANGYTVLVPDIFFGDPIRMNRPPGFDLQGWLNKDIHKPAAVDPVIETCLKSMRKDLGAQKVAAVGYCFGAKYVVRHLTGPGSDKIEVGYVAHPSFVDAEEIKAMRGPLSIAAAETDQIFPAEKRHETEVLLRELEPKQPYQITLYSGTEHGFATRSELGDPQKKWAKEAAFLQAMQWFDNWL